MAAVLRVQEFGQIRVTGLVEHGETEEIITVIAGTMAISAEAFRRAERRSVLASNSRSITQRVPHHQDYHRYWHQSWMLNWSLGGYHGDKHQEVNRAEIKVDDNGGGQSTFTLRYFKKQ